MGPVFLREAGELDPINQEHTTFTAWIIASEWFCGGVSSLAFIIADIFVSVVARRTILLIHSVAGAHGKSAEGKHGNII